jgi:hypothetical protein
MRRVSACIHSPTHTYTPILTTSTCSSSIPGRVGKMHKITNFTGQARHGWDRMTPAAFGMSRPHSDVSASQQLRRPQGPPSATPANPVDSTVNLAFNVPFASNLPGPEAEDVLHSSPGAFQRWTFPAGTADGIPTHKLPVHADNIEALRKLCRQISEQSGGRIEASVTSSELKAAQSLQRRPNGQVSNVCISGEGDLVHKMRAKVLNETPISLVRHTTHAVQNMLIRLQAILHR